MRSDFSLKYRSLWTNIPTQEPQILLVWSMPMPMPARPGRTGGEGLRNLIGRKNNATNNSKAGGAVPELTCPFMLFMNN